MRKPHFPQCPLWPLLNSCLLHLQRWKEKHDCAIDLQENIVQCPALLGARTVKHVHYDLAFKNYIIHIWKNKQEHMNTLHFPSTGL